jgi:hypothetical protein
MAKPIGWMWDDRPDTQRPFDIAVVMPTIVRPCITRALDSIFRQDFSGSIQIIIGIDRPVGDIQTLIDAFEKRPAHIAAYVIALPYSTSQRHGGVHSALDGGALRAILTLSAHTQHVAYLDDDNAWQPNHLRLLSSTIVGKAYAFSRRMLVHEDSHLPIAIDRWDSVGPGRGRFADSGGFVDPNCLLVDKIAIANHLGRWSSTLNGQQGLTADRNFFSAFSSEPHAECNDVTVLYSIRSTNILLQMAHADLAR